MRLNSGTKTDMTTPRLWPTDMKNHRDRAAELLVSVERDLDQFVDESPEIARAMIKVQKALRHLEKAGAQTRPE